MSVRTCRVLVLAALVCAGCGTKEKPTTELLTDLKGAEERDRVIAVRTLTGRTEDAAQVVPALIEALKDPQPDVRLSAAIGLGGYGDRAKDAIPALQTAVGDRDARVSREAGKALTLIDPVRFPTPPKAQKPNGK
jgi:HEAT repeat protein